MKSFAVVLEKIGRVIVQVNGKTIAEFTEGEGLCIANSMSGWLNAAHEAGILAERKRCARIAKNHGKVCQGIITSDCHEAIADAIMEEPK